MKNILISAVLALAASPAFAFNGGVDLTFGDNEYKGADFYAAFAKDGWSFSPQFSTYDSTSIGDP